MKKASTLDDGNPFTGGGGGGGLPDGPRRSARQAALTPKPRPKSRPRAVNRAIMRDIGSRPVDVLLARVAFGMHTSLLHPQLVSLIALYHERGTPRLSSWEYHPLNPLVLLSTVSTPLSVASIWLRDIANAISDGADPIAAMNVTLFTVSNASHSYFGRSFERCTLTNAVVRTYHASMSSSAVSAPSDSVSYTKPEQKFPTPAPGAGERVFYETLLAEKPSEWLV